MTNIIHRVTRFHEAFGHPVRLSPSILDEERLTLRIRLIEEEIEELHQALDNGDLIETVDALGDIVYVTVGMALEEGVWPDLITVDDTGIDMGTPTLDLTDEDIRFFETQMENVSRDLTGVPITAEIDNLNALVDFCFQMAGSMGVNLTPVVVEIHESNMTKLAEDGSVIYDDFGKVMKSETYVKPDIAGVLEAQRGA